MLQLTPEQRVAIESDPALKAKYDNIMAIQAGIADLRAENGGVAFLYPDWKNRPHPKQTAFFESCKESAMFSGAQGSGKTYILCQLFAHLALGRHPTIDIPAPRDFWLVGLSYHKVEQVLLPLFRRMLPYGREISWDAKAYQMKIRADDGSISTVGFMSAEAGQEKFQSNRLDGVGMDEAPQKNAGVRIFQEIQSRFKPGRKLYLRLAGTPWLLPRTFRDYFWVGAQQDPTHVDCITVGLADNPYVPPEQVKFQATKYVGKELRARIFGEFVSLSGVVFDTFDYDGHVIDDFPIPAAWPRYCGIDPTEGRRPWVFVWIAISPEGRHYVYKQLEIGGTYEDIVTACKMKEAFEDIVYRAIDPFAAKFNMSTGTDWITELARLGLPTKKVDRSKRSMHRSYVARLLGDPNQGVNPKLYFFRDGASKVWQAMQNHEWKDSWDESKVEVEKETEMDDVFKDFVDALLYGLSFHPRYFNVEQHIAKKQFGRRTKPRGLDGTFGY